ncbi:hypothetical protein QCA50_002131 [Cerrena zonata]|uniref:Uncharacterized protein n=1 Tax=Cerrena zonata TaxID=2478898 RepID=A0AAW0GNK0_9APHY
MNLSTGLNYMVQIDSEGKLRWARNGDLVDTTAGRWKDAGDGKGIVPLSYPETAAPRRRTSFVTPSPRSSSSGFANQVESAMHYYDGGKAPHNRFKRLIWRNFTLRGLLDRLLRKTLRRNTWIYVSDKNFNIFVGIKSMHSGDPSFDSLLTDITVEPGTFQHSSFLAGGLVTSAGLISIKDGMIHTLSPLSGHYRTEIHVRVASMSYFIGSAKQSEQHFRRFLKVLDERGVDLTKVKVSKAEAALWGIEHLNKFKKKQAALVKEGKEAVGDAANETVQAIANPADTAHAWKNVILEGRKRNVESDHEQPRRS